MNTPIKNQILSHKSWKDLEPKVNENLETYDSYYERIEKLNYSHIPKEVIHQWIFPLYNDQNSIKNYSWIDLSKVKFDLIEVKTSFFNDLSIIDDNKKMVNEYPINKFALWHRKFWEDNGTWEIPPIIIDVASFINEKPDNSEMNGKYQLIEGHNRLGTLKLLLKDGRIKIVEKHSVWVMLIED
ncbi:hypothetical protein CW736_07835 [Nonlabens sp. MB-3u-79]|uniref:hypothetical protein n=1 Tax=Nonlabens sp. MB-3u-79 TaxID=2058134 RepID=UPI000C30605B|nr:hypothetical protein [Nonlabens sp. MB-3u-79]AUC79300.1 hypothetical protein CW736_07835 [Nonlabens sp. MB-3u-79]